MSSKYGTIAKYLVTKKNKRKVSIIAYNSNQKRWKMVGYFLKHKNLLKTKIEYVEVYIRKGRSRTKYKTQIMKNIN